MGTLVAAAFLGLRGEVNKRGGDMALHAPSLQDPPVGGAASVTKSDLGLLKSRRSHWKKHPSVSEALGTLWRNVHSVPPSLVFTALSFLQTQQAAAHLPPP